MQIVKKKKALSKAVKAIKNGQVIICPTDTVYGFVADATNKKAVEKIFRIKKRPKSKPLPVFVRDIKMARELAQIDANQEKILKKYWPGKFTFILKIQKLIELGARSKLYGLDKNTIALRIPKYKFLNDLLKKINKPLVQTSVNISGKPALAEIKGIISVFEKQKNKPDLIVNAGNLQTRKPSFIIDITKDKIKILRP
mgnify:CR=1 FL=1